MRSAAVADPAPASQHSRTAGWWVAWLGWVYLISSVACSAAYVAFLGPHFANDYFWKGFNCSGGQTFLGDVFNQRMATFGSIPQSLALSSAIAQKTYDTPGTYIDISPSYARQLVLADNLVSLDSVVMAMRSSSLATLYRVFTQYCWIDFDRQFELAHTEKRQARCAVHYRPNAAMYLEPLFRNIMGGFGTIINTDSERSLLSPLQETPQGAQWLRAMYAHVELPSPAAEVEVWRSKGITFYQAQLQNLYQHGIHDTILIVNALGLEQRMTIHQVPMLGRGLTKWTTATASIGLWNDLTICQGLGCTLMRNTPRNISSFMEWTYDELFISGGVDTPSMMLFRHRIGPLGSVDVYLMPLPRLLSSYFEAFQRHLLAHLAVPTSTRPGVARAFVDPIPGTWQTEMRQSAPAVYLSGNLLCFSGKPRQSPQSPFSFTDSCSDDAAGGFMLESDSVMFAVLATANTSYSTAEACSLCETTASSCLQVVDEIKAVLPAMSLPHFEENTLKAVTDGGLAMTHYAFGDNQTALWLEQPLVATHDPFSFFGWVAVYEWLSGRREVYSFTGDEGNITIMSARHELVPFLANPLELPRQACTYVWFAVVYSTGIIGFVSVLLVAYGAMRDRSQHHRNHRPVHLFWFNSVAGCVWVGRPLLCLRGATALVLLSTASIELQARGGVSFFQHTRRSLVEIALMAGEATWLTVVLNDLLIPLVRRRVRELGPTSMALTWLALVAVEVAAPVQGTLVLDRVCHVSSLSFVVECSSGSVEIGSAARLCLLLGLVGGVVGMVHVTAWMAAVHNDGAKGVTPHAVLPAAAIAYFTMSQALELEGWPLDRVSCVMAGLLPLKSCMFDVKLWLLFKPNWAKSFTLPRSSVGSHRYLNSPRGALVPVGRAPLLYRTLPRALCGLVYVVLTVVGSYSYLALSKSTFSNDFLWASMNASGTLTYLVNLYNIKLQTLNRSDLKLDSPAYGDWSMAYNGSTEIAVAPLYASLVQHEANTLAHVVDGLRRMDGCQLPWIFTPYCYVDFERRWEMAGTAARQDRCRSDVDNGAVYLESFLRNAEWNALTRCWGSSMETGVFAYLRESKAGASWVVTVQHNTNSIADEVQVWVHHGIRQYMPQWQTFKALGVIETLSIQNAIGVSYSVTLKSINGTFQLSSENSFKMYWGLASDLWAISSNASGVGGGSLVRQSPRYAYANQSLDATYLLNSSNLVMGSAFASLRSKVGPFGTIDMKRVAVPTRLLAVYQTAVETLSGILTTNTKAFRLYDQAVPREGMAAVPGAWRGLSMGGGGNLLCDATVVPHDGRGPLLALFTAEGSCHGLGGEMVYFTPQAPFVAHVMAHATNRDIRYCDVLQAPSNACEVALQGTRDFIDAFVPPDKMTALYSQAADAKAHFLSEMTIEMSQYVQHLREVVFVHTSLFNASHPDFDFFAAVYLINWIEGSREVVAFTGDHLPQPLTLISGYTPPRRSQVNPMEIPVNTSFYVRRVVQYITFVLFTVACLVCLLIVTNRGYIEGANMLLFNRVAGLVWVGRPLVLLRGLAAIALLSTSNLELTRIGRSYFLADATPYWVTTIMSSGEVTWLVYILNDTLSVFTKGYTARYSMVSSLAVWGGAAVWTFLRPATHTARIHRDCAVPVVDFQIVCDSGTVYIGSYSRFVTLMGATAVITFLCYLVERCVHPRQSQRKYQPPSFFLYAAANHQFLRKDWVHADVYFIDKASAAIVGLLVVEFNEHIHLLDIKTWRVYVVAVAERRQRLIELNMPPSFVHAIPLVE